MGAIEQGSGRGEVAVGATEGVGVAPVVEVPKGQALFKLAGAAEMNGECLLSLPRQVKQLESRRALISGLRQKSLVCTGNVNVVCCK